MLKIRTLCLCLTLLQTGCQLTRTAPPLPANFEHSAEIPGFENIRSQFTDYDQRMIKEQSTERVKQLAKTYPDILFHEKGYFSLLVVSGGGDFGAFGAGILNGWTQSGKRPDFTTVTGISTGALIAPLAFAGPKYDKALREAYTTISAKDVFTDKPVLWTLLTGGESLKDYKPLQKLLDKYVTAIMLDDIAKAYYQGRRLYIGTTNLYSRDLVVWDMTRIATSKNPERLALFKKILLASASIPAVFPPVYFDVMAQGKIYSEMHVDGGTTFAVFLSRLGSDLKAAKEHFQLKKMPNVKIFVIRNNQNRFPYKIVKPKLLSIGKRALESVTAAQGSADVIFIYLCSLLQHVDFNLTYIPPDFVAETDDMFDQKQMNVLYQIGYKKGRTGNFWEKIPPDVAILHR